MCVQDPAERRLETPCFIESDKRRSTQVFHTTSASPRVTVRQAVLHVTDHVKEISYVKSLSI